MAPPAGRRASPLARDFAIAYAALVVYASLYPFSGWRETGAHVFDFLTAPWPRYWSWFDLALNVLAYVPLGLLCVAAFRSLKAGSAALVTFVLGFALSFSLELAQNFLDSRVPSNVDLGSNVLGLSIGTAIGLRYSRYFAPRGILSRWRQRRIVRGTAGDLGLTLLALWLLVQLNPDSLLFGVGDLRSMFGLEPPIFYEADLYFLMEILVAVCGMTACGLLAWHMMRETSAWLLGVLFALALLTKALAWAVLVEPSAFAGWLTAGTRVGLIVGALALAVTLVLPPRARLAVAALALLAATALVNLAPENPYAPDALLRWNQRHFFNFNGLTRIASSVWPFLALAYLMTLGGRVERQP